MPSYKIKHPLNNLETSLRRLPVYLIITVSGVVGIHLGLVIPSETDQLILQDIYLVHNDFLLKVALIVIHMHKSIQGTEQHDLTIRTPLHLRQLHLKLLSPVTRAVHTSHNHRPVQIYYRYLLAVIRPLPIKIIFIIRIFTRR